MKTLILTTTVGLACFTLGFLARPIELSLPYAFPKADEAGFIRAKHQQLMTEGHNIVQLGASCYEAEAYNHAAAGFNAYLATLPESVRAEAEPVRLLVYRGSARWLLAAAAQNLRSAEARLTGITESLDTVSEGLRKIQHDAAEK